jgi:pimeloyl-ACP methyl ester carboxylesterase
VPTKPAVDNGVVTTRIETFGNDGLTFDVRDSGPLDGDLVIALHGFPQTSASWAEVSPVLTDAGLRVLAPDQRGYSPGARPKGVAHYGVSRLAGDVLALADAAGVERFHLLGHDWGGIVGWHLAATYPDRVRTLSVASAPHPRALIRAMAGRQAVNSWYMGFFQLPGLAERALTRNDGATTRRLATASGMRDPEAAVRLLAEPGAATATINWYRAVRSPGAPLTGEVHIPVLYVWSDRDPALGRRAAELTRRWVTGDYRFEVLTGVSHWIPDQAPTELAELVLARIG